MQLLSFFADTVLKILFSDLLKCFNLLAAALGATIAVGLEIVFNSLRRGMVDDFYFFACSSAFFCYFNFIVLFPYFTKY